jgi:hypothetical protein
MLRLVLGPALVALLAISAEAVRRPEVAVIFAAEQKSAGDSWIPGRLADLAALRLRMLGTEARDRRFLDAGGHVDLSVDALDGCVVVRVRPEAALDPATTLSIELEINTATGKSMKKKLSGPAESIEHLSAEVALALLSALGSAVTEEARALIQITDYPFSVQRSLGIARAELDQNNARQSMVMYDRAAQLLKLGTVPEAIAGRALAEASLISQGEMEFGAKADLAPPAEERAQVALKKGDDHEAVRSLEAFLRYTPDRALRWTLELPMTRETATVIAHGSHWVVQNGTGGKRRFTIDPRTGFILHREPGLSGLVDLASGHSLVLDEKTLARIDEQGHVRWRVNLPLKPRSLMPNAVELTSGLAGVMADDAIAWVEVSFGQIAQVANGVRPLASGTGGILVELSPSALDAAKEIGLLRPGKKTPAWTAQVPQPQAAAMTVDRVLVATSSALILLRSHDGKESARTIPIPASARILGAEGRYAAIAVENDEVAVIDVLGGERTATIKSPGRPLASYTSATGVAILYATGDLIFYDRDGIMLDRALVPGEPLSLLPGSPMTPGPVAVSTRGLLAYAEVASDVPRMRDVDAMLRLGQVFAKVGEMKVAQSWARHVALASAGRIDRAEALRFEILWKLGDAVSKSSARAAAKRKDAAKDPTRTLFPFQLVEQK